MSGWEGERASGRNGEPATEQSSVGRIASRPYAVSLTRPFAFLALPAFKT